MKNKKVLVYSLTTVLLLGVIAMVGFLSFTGMLLIAPYVGLAIGSFYFAAVVEGEAYKQNIFKGIKKLLTPNYTKKKILRKKLHDFIKDKDKANLQNSQFLQDYKKQKLFLIKLKKQHADKQLIQKQKKRLRYMKLFFARWIYEDEKLPNNSLTTELDNIIDRQTKLQIQTEISRKIKLGRVAWIFYILAGISSAFASVSCIHSGMTTLMITFGFTLAPSLLLGGIIPLAIIAGIGYTLMLYHNVSNLIQNDTLQKWAKKILDYFTYKPNENILKYIARVAGVGILVTAVIGLAVFATVATAGTWWVAVKQGARLIPYFAAAADWIRNISIPGMSLPTLFVNIKNSFKTMQTLMDSSLVKKLQGVYKKIEDTKKEEEPLQFVNPFRIITKLIEIPFTLINIVGHLIADSVMNDNLGPVPHEVSLGLNIASEGLEHSSYFMEPDEKEDQKDELKEDQEQHHTTLVDVVSLVILLPLYGLSLGWDYAFGKKSLADSAKKIFEPYITLFDKFISFSSKKNQAFELPTLSNEWQQQELVMKLEKKAEKHKSKSSEVKEKRSEFKNEKASTSLVSLSKNKNNFFRKPMQLINYHRDHQSPAISV